jgi:hypothetical protein
VALDSAPLDPRNALGGKIPLPIELHGCELECERNVGTAP